MNASIVKAGLRAAVGGSAALLVLPSCARLDSNVNVKPEPIEIKPIEVKPIHLTVDVNIRVDRELDDFFDFERRLDPDQADRTRPLTETTRPATAAPVTQPAAATDAQSVPIPPVPPAGAGAGVK